MIRAPRRPSFVRTDDFGRAFRHHTAKFELTNTMTDSLLRIDRPQPGCAVLILDRPDPLNALSQARPERSHPHGFRARVLRRTGPQGTGRLRCARPRRPPRPSSCARELPLTGDCGGERRRRHRWLRTGPGLRRVAGLDAGTLRRHLCPHRRHSRVGPVAKARPDDRDLARQGDGLQRQLHRRREGRTLGPGQSRGGAGSTAGHRAGASGRALQARSRRALQRGAIRIAPSMRTLSPFM